MANMPAVSTSDLTDPAVFDQRLSLGVDLFGNETFANTNQSFDSTVYGAKVSLGTPLNDHLGVTGITHLQSRRLARSGLGTSSLPIQQAAAAGPIWVSSIGNSVTYSRSTMPRIRPAEFVPSSTMILPAWAVRPNSRETTDDVRYYHPSWATSSAWCARKAVM